MTGNIRLTSKADWNRFWRPHRSKLRRVNTLKYFHFWLDRFFQTTIPPYSKVLEAGCGGSIWLPHLARQGHEAWGVDFSPEGIELSETYKRAYHTCERLILADVFDQAILPVGYFDVVYSSGFVEHFTDTDSVICRKAELARPGGLIITSIPNYTHRSLWGKLMKWLFPMSYAKHVPLDTKELDRAHERANLLPIVRARYWGCFGPGLIGSHLGHLSFLISQVTQQAVCNSFRLLRCELDSAVLSPFILCAYRKLQ